MQDKQITKICQSWESIVFLTSPWGKENMKIVSKLTISSSTERNSFVKKKKKSEVSLNPISPRAEGCFSFFPFCCLRPFSSSTGREWNLENPHSTIKASSVSRSSQISQWSLSMHLTLSLWVGTFPFCLSCSTCVSTA